VQAHPDFTTTITPPHFYVSDDRSADLNIVLAADTAHHTDKPLRAILTVSRKYADKHAQRLASGYVQAGIGQLELRLSPFGGEDESLAKIRSGFTVLDTFRDAGIITTLGMSGTIGHAAVALGHAAAFSVGIGLGEHVNHKADLSRQQRPPTLDENGKKKGGGPGDGVYLPGIHHTLSRTNAATLLGHSDVRMRLLCRLEDCATSIAGPTIDPRRHYLHARAYEMQALLQRPDAWRAQMEVDRLGRALTLRQLINDHHPHAVGRGLKLRTLRSIVDLAAGEQDAQSA